MSGSPMLLPAERRRQLGAFVRSRREALPSTAGGGRRTPGLRREEVAERCGLSAAERAYLFELALQRDPRPGGPGPDVVPPELEAAVAAVGPPCYLIDRLWRARAWNEAAARLFTPWLGGSDPSLLGFVFRDDAARNFILDWEKRARRVIAEFRADTARAPEDPALLALVAELRAASPAFATLWDGHAVAARDGGARRFRHPEDGILVYEQVTLVPAAYPDHKLVMLLPCPGPSPA